MPQMPPVLTPFTKLTAKAANAKSHEARRRNTAAQNLDSVVKGKKGLGWTLRDVILVAKDALDRVKRLEERLDARRGGRPRNDGLPPGSVPVVPVVDSTTMPEPTIPKSPLPAGGPALEQAPSITPPL